MVTRTIIPPDISQYFDPNLLKRPLGFTHHVLKFMYGYIIAKYKRKLKSPKAIQRFEQKQQEFLDLYERIEKKKEDPKTTKNNVTERPFYYIRFVDPCQQDLFNRLRRRTRKFTPTESENSKIQEI